MFITRDIFSTVPLFRWSKNLASLAYFKNPYLFQSSKPFVYYLTMSPYKSGVLVYCTPHSCNSVVNQLLTEMFQPKSCSHDLHKICFTPTFRKLIKLFLFYSYTSYKKFLYCLNSSKYHWPEVILMMQVSRFQRTTNASQ